METNKAPSRRYRPTLKRIPSAAYHVVLTVKDECEDALAAPDPSNEPAVGGRIGAPGRAPYSAAKWGVEGFSEVLAKEMSLVGVKVTIIEPGGFRTDFAGSSTVLREGRPEYDAVVGAAARAQREYDGRQPGDPTRAAQAILAIAAMDEPPFRLPLGSDAVRLIEQADRTKLDELQRWRQLSISTDFPATPQE